MAHHFTLAEARALLPVVGRNIRDSVQAKERYQDAEAWLQNLGQRILMQGGMTVDINVAEATKSQRDSNAHTLKNSIEKLEELGVVIKDLDIGLVDFPTLYKGEEVYLCWRMDEADIEHWHGVHEGFAGRKEIDQSFVDNHCGEEHA